MTRGIFCTICDQSLLDRDKITCGYFKNAYDIYMCNTSNE